MAGPQTIPQVPGNIRLRPTFRRRLSTGIPGKVLRSSAFDPHIFARWRCWKEYGTGVAGDLLVHLISGMMFMLNINEAPRQAMAVGGIRRCKKMGATCLMFTPLFITMASCQSICG